MEHQKINKLISEFNLNAVVRFGPIKVYTISEANGENWSDHAQEVCDQYLLSDGSTATVKDNKSITAITQPYDAADETTLECLNHAKQAGLVDENTDVRLLVSPGIKVRALWLRKDGKDTFIPYGHLKIGKVGQYQVDPDFTQNLKERVASIEKARQAALKSGIDPNLSGG